MRRDDLLAQALERERQRGGHQALEPLLEGGEEPLVARIEAGRKRALEALEQRPLRSRAPKEDERVVRDADERRSQNRQQRLVVVPVVQQPEIGEQVADLLLAEIAAPEAPMRPDSHGP